ncbi:MAG: hypothetical protein QW153_03780 [Candidatus Bilamarchaeaceae archaeon]
MKKIIDRLSNAYERTINNIVEQIKERIKESNKSFKKKMNADELRKLADEMNEKKYLSFSVKVNYRGNKEEIQKYKNDIENASKKILQRC